MDSDPSSLSNADGNAPSSTADEDFDVDCIMAEKWEPTQGRMLYLVSWTTFTEKDYTWEPAEHFHDHETLSDWQKYKDTHPASARFDWRAWDLKYGNLNTQQEALAMDLDPPAPPPAVQVSTSAGVMPPTRLASNLANRNSHSPYSGSTSESVSSTDSLAQELRDKASFAYKDKDYCSTSNEAIARPDHNPSAAPEQFRKASPTEQLESASLSGDKNMQNIVVETTPPKHSGPSTTFKKSDEIPSKQKKIRKNSISSSQRISNNTIIHPIQVNSIMTKPTKSAARTKPRVDRLEKQDVTSFQRLEGAISNKYDVSTKLLATNTVEESYDLNREIQASKHLSDASASGDSNIARTKAGGRTESGMRATRTEATHIATILPESRADKKPQSQVHYMLCLDPEDISIGDNVSFTGLSEAFCNHLENRNLKRLLVSSYLSFEYLETIFVEEQGVPHEQAFVEGGNSSIDQFVTQISELQGVAVIREESFTMLLAPSHARRFRNVFALSHQQSSKMHAVVYPPLDIQFLGTRALPDNSAFESLGQFIIESCGLQMGDQSALLNRPMTEVILLPSLRNSRYGHDILNALQFYPQKVNATRESFHCSITIISMEDVLSKRIKLSESASASLFLIHKSLLRNIHIIPGLSHIRFSRKDALFYTYGPSLDFGDRATDWSIYPIFPSGGVLLLTLELILHESPQISQLLNAITNPGSSHNWSIAIPEDITSLLEDALAMNAVHERLSKEQLACNADVLGVLKGLICMNNSSNRRVHILDVTRPSTSNINYTESCLDAFVKFQVEAVRDYRFFAVICGSGLIEKKAIERQYTNLDLFGITEFLDFIAIQ